MKLGNDCESASEVCKSCSSKSLNEAKSGNLLFQASLVAALLLFGSFAAAHDPVYTHSFVDDTTGNNEFISPSDNKKYWYIDAQPGDANAGADNYFVNVYERPTIQTFQNKSHPTLGTVWASEQYYPYLDLIGGKLGLDSPFVYVALHLFGVDLNGQLSQEYTIELDVDGDMRGDVLLVADNPGDKNATPSYTQNSLFGYKDTNNDVGGTDPALSQSNGDLIDPGLMNGYETPFFSDANPYFWCRIDPTDSTKIEFQIDYVALGSHLGVGISPDSMLIKFSGADKGVQDPQKYWFHDKYTLSQAGTPYDDGYTLGNIYEYDNMRVISFLTATGCDTFKIADHFTLVFDGVVYDSINETSTWTYSLEWDGTPPALSHFIIELCSLLTDANLVDVEPNDGTIGFDGSTGLYGIKWEDVTNFPANTPVTFSFTLDQMLAIDHTQFAPKAGVNSNIASICGPALDCQPCDNDNVPPVFVNCPADMTVQCDGLPAPPVNIVGTDNCDPNPTVSYLGQTTNPGNCAQSYIVTRRWVITDASGNADTCIQVITVIDTTPPTITNCPDSISVQCNAIPAIPTVTAMDNCDSTVTTAAYLGETSVSGSCPQSYTLTRKWVASDACGNISDTCVQVITVNDNIKPVITNCPADITVQCNAIPDPPTVLATDECDPDPTVSYLGQTINPGNCPYTITRKWVAIDSCGNVSDTCVQTVTVNDTNSPAITCPGPVTVQCFADVPAPDVNSVTASDSCGMVTVTHEGDSASGSCPTIITRTYKATDPCGNFATCTQIITVDDTIAPVLTGCPANASFQCLSNVPAAANVTANDNCIGAITPMFSEQQTNPGSSCNNTITRTWTATDSCGNVSTCSQTITVDDTTAPVLAGCPSNVTVQCYADVPDTANVMANDNCIGAITPMFSEQQTNPGSSCNNTITRTWTATDSCGNLATCTQTITVNDNMPPEPSSCPTNASYQCFSQVPAPANVTFNDNCSGAITPTFSEIQTNPGSSCNNVITRTWTASDACGNQGSCVQTITVNDNTKPICSVPNDTTITLCAPGNICLAVSATDNCDTSPSCSKLSGPGTYSGGQWCFNASSGNQTIVGIFQCIDDCNNVCVDTVNVHLVVNTAPMLSVNVSSPVTVCETGDTICVPFTVVDPDNGHSYQTLIGWVNSGPKTACFIADTTGNYCNRLIVKDSCNLADTINYCVQVNVCPIPNLGPDSTKDFGSVCLPVSGNFRLRNFSGCGPVTWQVNNTNCSQDTTINYSAGYCTNFNQTWAISVTDGCGRTDSYTVTIKADVNCLPNAGCPTFIPDKEICSLGAVVCISGNGFVCSDDDGNASSTLNGQPYNPGEPICFTPNAFGPFTLTLICSDGCAADTCSSVVNIVQGGCLTGCGNVVIEKTHNTIQGQFESVDITIDSMATPIGGFDLLVEYDASALSLSQVQPGSFISACGWEYFTYRLGGCTNCAPNACPSGSVRIIAIAEINNGPNHPACFQMEPAQLATLIFLVTNDRTFECQYVPIRFKWCDCGDNTFSSVTGDTLYLAEHVYDYYDGSSWTEITDPTTSFPTNFGPNVSCDVLIGDDKPDPRHCIDFYNGGIDIVCADSIDDRGDINLNGVSNEVADAVLLGNYFVYGMAVFTVNIQGQIAASDINADGTVLSVADLVYLIRVVIGDALAYSKLAPVNVKFNVSEDGRLSVDQKVGIGAAFVVVQGQVEPKLLADQMEIKYNFDGTHTRILVWSLEGQSFTGDFLQVNAPITSIEMATAEGSPVALNTVPTEYALNQNYPNPFNPKTNISFSLPRASDYTLTIFNVNGQEVARFRGVAESAGSFEIEWEAGNYASGIYFYRLTAGRFTDMKKMILLK